MKLIFSLCFVSFWFIFYASSLDLYCLFPVKHRIGSSSTQHFLRITPSFDRYNGVFPSIINFISSENRSNFVYNSINSGYQTVDEPSNLKTIIPTSIGAIIISNNNILSVAGLSPISNVNNVCFVPKTNTIVIQLLHGGVLIYKRTSFSYTYQRLLPDVVGNFTQITCGDSFYFLLRQDGALFGAGNSRCGRLGILSSQKDVPYPTLISSAINFTRIVTLYLITMGQVSTSGQWTYWGANTPSFFEKNSDEACYYIEMNNTIFKEYVQ